MKRIVMGLLLVVLVGCGRRQAPAEGDVKKEEPRVVQAKKDPAPKKETPPDQKPPEKKPHKDSPSVISTVARRMEIPEVLNGMRQLGLTYLQIQTEGRAPATLQELHGGIDPKTREALDKGWIVFILNAGPRQMPEGPANTILAYEVDADRVGRRVVLMGDGSVKEVNLQEFAKMPKAQGK